MAFNLTDVQAEQKNPLTPMAFLTPVYGYQATVSAYVQVGSVAALIWDIIIHVDSDFKLLFREKIGIPTIVYFISRASSLVWTLLNVIFSTTALSHCDPIARAICVIFHIAFSSTALLFFLRVRAVFNKNKFIVVFFGILWLGVLGTSIAVASVGNGVHIGPTNYCMNTVIKAYASAAPIALAINDTFVFLAISWRLLSNSIIGHETKLNIKSMILGGYLPAFSKALLHDGQLYYLVSITINITVAIALWEGNVPHPYCNMLLVFNVVFTNMMACQVFRHTKFGDFKEDISFVHRTVPCRDLEGKGYVKPQLPVSLELNQSDTNQHEYALQKGGRWHYNGESRAARENTSIVAPA